jgi:uncharacterized coiled-coil protein SlyX
MSDGELVALHARIDELEKTIAEREVAIAERVRSLATSQAITEPMERHRARVRELEATLAEARRERDAVRASLPDVASLWPTALAILVVLALALRVLVESRR